MTDANTRVSPEPDWIERLRELAHDLQDHPSLEDDYFAARVMPLLCDVVEAAHIYNPEPTPGQPGYAAFQHRRKALAALRAEVERDA